jgi:polyferredoxin
MTEPPARSGWLDAADAAVLVAALALASWLALKKRSRRGIAALMILTILYFGFWRQGCICPIGAIGSVTLGRFAASYAIPLIAGAFFFLPIVFTLFWGRSFCGGVCPLGAVQDVVLLRPVRIPAWLETSLRLFAWLYLSLAILYAATASAFIICRYDPFIAFFRLSANPAMWAVSIGMLVLAMFVGRPYCRFLCPLGVILRQASRLSRHPVTITPDECINCRLCEDACPYGAIEKPTVEWARSEHDKGRKRLLVYFLLLPAAIAAGATLGWVVHPKLAAIDPTVVIAREVRQWQSGRLPQTSDIIKAFQNSGQSSERLFEQANAKRHQFAVGSTLVGGWMGFVAIGSLITSSIFARRSGYQPHRGGCLSCGRCFDSCPRHRLSQKPNKHTQPSIQVEEQPIGS